MTSDATAIQTRMFPPPNWLTMPAPSMPRTDPTKANISMVPMPKEMRVGPPMSLMRPILAGEYRHDCRPINPTDARASRTSWARNESQARTAMPSSAPLAQRRIATFEKRRASVPEKGENSR